MREQGMTIKRGQKAQYDREFELNFRRGLEERVAKFGDVLKDCDQPKPPHTVLEE